tara:strand:- start:154 stop:516 length:363 start_codon:yes stop_codon:yes gene_type:complete
LWSGLSVLSLNFENAKSKIYKRIASGSVGILLGFASFYILPSNEIITDLAFIGILLSLVAFKKYQHSFGARCYFVVLFAGSQALATGEIRFYDVIFGGVVGLLCSMILSKIDYKLVGKRI